MAPLLAVLGFNPVRLESLAHLESSVEASWRGAIISLAISSSVGATAAEVVQALRAKVPRLPLAFAGMVPMDTAASSIKRLFDGQPPAVADVDSQRRQARPLGGTDTCLYFSKAQIGDPAMQAEIRKMMAAHFR
ncbi:MAG: hypothetical protein KGK06_09035 [Xanthomonadaceae bacterium]|nr:hypothetical protein [Xanthomonadaceae bacterium]MDE2316533.1 hypothetical protein [Xanthomonadaceae bacterium]